MMIRMLFSLLPILILESTTTDGALSSEVPMNLAVYKGDKDILIEYPEEYCNVIAWYFFPTSDKSTHIIIDYTGYRDPTLEGLFDPNQSGLVVLDATTTASAGGPISTSGVYWGFCNDDGRLTSAKFIVVLNPPECSCNASSPDAVRLSCAISYADKIENPIYAKMTWKVGGIFHTTETPNRTESGGGDGNLVWVSTSTITVDNSFAADYECIVSFNAPVMDQNLYHLSTNAPEFSASCLVSVCGVATKHVQTTLPLTTNLLTTNAGDCISSMKNIAVYEGYQNTIMNLTADPNDVKWTIVATSDEFDGFLIQDYGGYKDPSLEGLFYPNQSGLVVLNATTTPTVAGPISTSGLYIAQCSSNEDNRIGAKLVVVRSAPECLCKDGVADVVQLSCSIFYADATLHPIKAKMTWSIDGVFYATDTPEPTKIDYYVFESTSTITVDKSFQAKYRPTCVITFTAPTDIEYDFIATNAPDFSANCSIAACGVQNRN